MCPPIEAFKAVCVKGAKRESGDLDLRGLTQRHLSREGSHVRLGCSRTRIEALILNALCGEEFLVLGKQLTRGHGNYVHPMSLALSILLR